MMKTNKTRKFLKRAYLFLLPAMSIILTLLFSPALNAKSISKPSKVIVKEDSISNALFVVDGKIRTREDANKINPDEIKSVSVLKGASAVSSYEQEGKDGVIVITTLKNESNDSIRSEKSILNRRDGNQLILMNGKTISKDEMNKIDPATIESINVYKGDKAISLYDEKGKDGVIIITMKKEK